MRSWCKIIIGWKEILFLPATLFFVIASYLPAAAEDSNRWFYLNRLMEVYYDTKAEKKSFYFAFESSPAQQSNCSYAVDGVFFRKHGIRMTFHKSISVSLDTFIDADPQQAVGVIKDQGCAFVIRVQKFVRTADQWVVVSPQIAVKVSEPTATELRYWNSTDAKALNFTFDASTETCPEGIGDLYLLPDALVGEMSRRFTGISTPQPGSAFEREFTFETETCRYEMRVKHYVSSDSVFSSASVFLPVRGDPRFP
jgi:hypothetical protein